MIKAAALIEKFKYALDEKWGYIYGMKHVLWTAARQENYNQAKAGNPDCQMSIKYGSKWYGHYVTDCSGLFSWAFEVLGGYMYHGSNTMYSKYCVNKGTLKSGKKNSGAELKPGTAVFTGTADQHGHVGLYIGNGDVVEAKGALYGVVKSKVTEKRWTYWGELKGIEYAEAENPGGQSEKADEKDPVLPTLRRGDKNKYVKQAQELLKERGYSLGICGVDGDFGPATEKAVKDFQKDWGLAQDGIIGPKTWEKLQSTPAKEKTYTVTIRGLDMTQAKAICNNYPGSTMKEE